MAAYLIVSSHYCFTEGGKNKSSHAKSGEDLNPYSEHEGMRI
jgi:hypothetical protein